MPYARADRVSCDDLDLGRFSVYLSLWPLISISRRVFNPILCHKNDARSEGSASVTVMYSNWNYEILSFFLYSDISQNDNNNF